jgi:hypothetical protein
LIVKSLILCRLVLVSVLSSGAIVASPALADESLPPFDFSDAFYLENGIDPSTLVGRPNGSPPNSTIDNRDNGPDFNNVRLLSQTAAFDHSGHPIFFSVTGLPSLASFTDNAAGQEAFQIAETYNVYEFPRATNPPFSVFPKRQDLIADLRNGYFGNDPLGVWRINLVRFTPAAFDTPAGRDALNDLAHRNGVDLDGTPLVRTVSEIEDLANNAFVTIDVPPLDGSAGFRWFFCPVIEDPRNGAIAPDAFLEIIELPNGEPLPADSQIQALFNCLQRTGDFCPGDGVRVEDVDGDGSVGLSDLAALLSAFGTCAGDVAYRNAADMDRDRCITLGDLAQLLGAFGT